VDSGAAVNSAIQNAPSAESSEKAYRLSRPPAVIVEGLTKRFGDVTAVDNVTFAVSEGEFFGFLGPNGAGKSTTIKVLVGLIAAQYSRVRIAGFDLRTEPMKVKASIGVMLEDPHLYDRLTSREYLQFIGRMYGLAPLEADKRTEELIDLMDLGDAANKMIVDYSTGMRKKTVLAAAMIHNPKVLFLDEPFNGIDPVASRKIKDVMSRLVAHGATIFFSSHVMELVEKLCTSLAIIHRGALHFHEPMENIRRSGRSLEDIFVEIAGEGRTEAEELSWIN
jgi:ABC-2 type transport system ATP-binding protein